MLTLSNLKALVSQKKAAQEAEAPVQSPIVAAQEAVLPQEESASVPGSLSAALEVARRITGSAGSAVSQAVDKLHGALPASHNNLDKAQEEVLMIVAGVQQRVESIEEELQITTQVDEESSVQIVEGYKALIEARRNRMKQEGQEVKTTEPEAIVVKDHQSKQEEPAAPERRGTVKIKFDQIPQAE